jgi:two-component system, OmpR family, sensor kinase
LFKGIRGKLTSTYILLICIVMGVISVFLLNMLENYYLEYQREAMENSGNLVAEISSSFLHRESDLIILSAMAEDIARQINARVIIVDKQGMVLGDSQRVGGFFGQTLLRPEIVTALTGETGGSEQFSESSGQWIMQVAVPVIIEGEIRGAVFLASSLSHIYETLGAVRTFIFIATFLALVLVGFFAALMAKSFTTPLEDLTAAARQMAAGNLKQEIPIRREDEIGQLTRQFNNMSTRVMETNRQLREFVANASHELRTPLTTINLLVNSLKDFSDDKDIRDEFISDIDTETQRLISLVSDLLDLARLDGEAKNKSNMKPLDLAEFVREVVASVSSRIERQGLTMDYREGSQYLPVLANADELKQVLHNLLDNALKYTPPGGCVRVEVRGGAEEALVAVADTGCGIPGGDLEKVFERFYRVDKARSREQGGTGLGLSICRELIDRHHGEIWAESQEGKGTTIYFVLPLIVVKKD